MDKGMTFTIVVIVLLFVIIFVVAILFMMFGKDYLYKVLDEFPSLIGGTK
jgi:Na+/glutamate symporter